MKPRSRTLDQETCSGFTLVELMITVAIIAILAAIAYPSYTRQIQQSHRTDATQTLLSYAQMLERCYAQNPGGNPTGFTYQNCPNATQGQSYPSPNGYYTITVTAPGGDVPPDYSLTAVPSHGSAQATDSDCQSFNLTNNGTQTAQNGAGTDNSLACWGAK